MYAYGLWDNAGIDIGRTYRQALDPRGIWTGVTFIVKNPSRKKFNFALKFWLEMLFSLSLSPVGRLIVFNNRRFVQGAVQEFLKLVENCK